MTRVWEGFAISVQDELKGRDKRQSKRIQLGVTVE